MVKLVIILIGMSVSSFSYAHYFAGTWKANINPNATEFYESCLGGYGEPFSRCGSSQILDEISLRVLTIADHDTLVSFVVLDAVGVGDSLINEIGERVESISHGLISSDQIQVIATHTHAGPDLQGLWGGVDPGYRDRVIKKSAKAVVFSLVNMQPVHLTLSKTTAPVRNRRGWEAVDNEVNIISFKSKFSHRNVATLVNMSAHPTILDKDNLAYSAGYVHTLRRRIESRFGGNALFINGILGDAEPDVTGKTVSEAQEYGVLVGDRIIEAVLEKQDKLKGDLEIVSAIYTHPVSNPGIISAAELGLLDVELNESNMLFIPVYKYKFGDSLSIISVPGEALTRLNLKDELVADNKLVFGMAGASYGYFIPSDEFLQIEGRTTEEVASVDVFAGDHLKSVISDLSGL